MPKLNLRLMNQKHIFSKIKELGMFYWNFYNDFSQEYFGIIDEEHKKSNLFKALFID